MDLISHFNNLIKMSLVERMGFIQPEAFLRTPVKNGHVKRLQLVCRPDYEGVILIFGNMLFRFLVLEIYFSWIFPKIDQVIVHKSTFFVHIWNFWLSWLKCLQSRHCKPACGIFIPGLYVSCAEIILRKRSNIKTCNCKICK